MVENCTSMISNFNLTSDGFIFEEGSHNGYERIDNLIHQRRIDFNKSKKTFNIKDSFDNHEKIMTAHFVIQKMFLKLKIIDCIYKKAWLSLITVYQYLKYLIFHQKGMG